MRGGKLHLLEFSTSEAAEKKKVSLKQQNLDKDTAELNSHEHTV